MMRVGFAWEKRSDLLRHARETSKREAIEPNTMSIHYCVVCVFWLCTYLVRLRRRKNECSQPASEAVAAVEAVEAVALLARSLRLTPAAAVRSFQIVLCIIMSARASQVRPVRHMQAHGVFRFLIVFVVVVRLCCLPAVYPSSWVSMSRLSLWHMTDRFLIILSCVRPCCACVLSVCSLCALCVLSVCASVLCSLCALCVCAFFYACLSIHLLSIIDGGLQQGAAATQRRTPAAPPRAAAATRNIALPPPHLPPSSSQEVSGRRGRRGRCVVRAL